MQAAVERGETPALISKRLAEDGGGEGKKRKRSRPKKGTAIGCEGDAEEVFVAAECDFEEDGEDEACGEGGVDGGKETDAQHKRRRILQLATQLAFSDSEGSERRNALIHQLMAVSSDFAHGRPAGHFRFGPIGDDCTAPEIHSPCDYLDLEQGVDDLIAAAGFSHSSNASDAGDAGDTGGSVTAAAAGLAPGLTLDLKLLDGGDALELSGDVIVTADGMAVTPSGVALGLTPLDAPHAAAISAAICSDAHRDDDWLTGLLTPTNDKMCTALVDAF